MVYEDFIAKWDKNAWIINTRPSQTINLVHTDTS